MQEYTSEQLLSDIRSFYQATDQAIPKADRITQARLNTMLERFVQWNDSINVMKQKLPDEGHRYLDAFYFLHLEANAEKIQFLISELEKLPQAKLDGNPAKLFLNILVETQRAHRDTQPLFTDRILALSHLMFVVEQNGDPVDHAQRLSSIYPNDITTLMRYLDYRIENLQNLRKDEKAAAKARVFHDACLDIPNLNQMAHITIKAWQQLAKTNLKEDIFWTIIPHAASIESLIQADHSAVTESRNRTQAEIQQLRKKMKDSASKFSTEDKARLNELQDQVKADKEASHPHVINVRAQPIRDQIAVLNARRNELTSIHAQEGFEDYEEAEYDAIPRQIAVQELKLAVVYKGVPFDHKTPLEMLRAYKAVYRGQNEHFNLFIDHGIPENKFRQFVKEVLPNLKDSSKQLPNIIIAGRDVDPNMQGLYLRKVPETMEYAFQMAVGGKRTDSCQSYSGEAGEPCVVYGLTSENAGFYIVCEGDPENPQPNDRQLGLSLTWRGVDGGLCFDSVEIVKGASEQQQANVVGLFNRLAIMLVNEHGVSKVMCGNTSSGISKLFGESSPLVTKTHFIDYNGYSDAKKQRILYGKFEPWYIMDEDLFAKEATEALIQVIVDAKFDRSTAEYAALERMINWSILLEDEPKEQLQKMIYEFAGEQNKQQIDQIMHEITQFLEAVKRDDYQAVIAMLRDKKLVTTPAAQTGKTSLMSAINGNDWAAAEQLIKFGIDINAADEDGNTAAMFAVKQGSIDMMQKLIERGIDVNAVDINGDSIMVAALRKKDMAMVQLILDTGQININQTNSAGQTLLMVAIIEFPQAIDMFIEHGADANAGTLTRSPVHLAFIKNYRSVDFDLLRHLVKLGAELKDDMVISDPRQYYLIEYLMEIQMFDVARYCFQQNPSLKAETRQGQYPLLVAIKHNQPDLAKMIFENMQSFDVNGLDNMVSLAILNNMTDLAHQMLDKGISAVTKNSTMSETNNALCAALKTGSQDLQLIEKLLKQPNVDVNDIGSESALLLALNQKPPNLHLMELLKEQGADFYRADAKGDPLIAYAMRSDIPEEIFNFVLQNTDVNLLQSHLPYALPVYFQCIANANASCIERLSRIIDHVSNKNFLDENGVPALFFASDAKVIQLLLEKGADINSELEGVNILLKYIITFPSDPEQKAIVSTLVEQFPQTVERAQQLLGVQGNYSLVSRAIVAGNYEIAALLIEKGIAFSDQDVLQAIMRNHKNILDSMIEKGLDITKQNQSGETFLLQYIQQDAEPDVSIILYLCDKGIDPDQENNNGLTSLQYIMDKVEKLSEGYHSYHDVVNLFDVILALLKKGAAVETKSTTGNTLTQCMDQYQSELSRGMTEEIQEAIQKQAPKSHADRHIPAAFTHAIGAKQIANETQKDEDQVSEPPVGKFGGNTQ